MTNPDPFFDGYVACALWSSNDASTPAGGEPMDKNYCASDIDGETQRLMGEECAEFERQNRDALDSFYAITDRTPADAGHDFWLTRNGHGAGFWDRDAGAVGEVLTAAAHSWGECHLYVTDAGRVAA